MPTCARPSGRRRWVVCMPAFDLLASIATIELIKFVTEIRVPDLLGKFLTVNFWTWETELHEVLRLPALDRSEAPRPATCSPGRFSTMKTALRHPPALELQDVAPSDPFETIRRGSRLVSRKVGIIQRVVRHALPGAGSRRLRHRGRAGGLLPMPERRRRRRCRRRGRHGGRRR